MHYLQKHMDDFVNDIRTMIEDYNEKHFSVLKKPEVGVDNGRKYWRIWKTSGTQRTVYGFVRKDDGAILRAATWKAPQTKTKSAVRGYITDPNPLDYCGPYSVKYVQ